MVPSFLPTTNEFGLVGWKAKDMTQAWPPPIVATISPGVDLDRILIVSPEEEDESPTTAVPDDPAVPPPERAAKTFDLQSTTAPLAHPSATKMSVSSME